VVNKRSLEDWRGRLTSAARSFLKPRVFFVPASLSLIVACFVCVSVLGNVDITSLWPPALAGNLDGGLVPEAEFGVPGGTFRETSAALQATSLERYYLVLVAIALAAVLVAGLNLVILLKNRRDSRAHEEAVRMAVGASPRRLFAERLVGFGVVLGSAGIVGIGIGLVGKVGLALSWPEQGLSWPLVFGTGLAVPLLAIFLLLVLAFSLRPAAGRRIPGGANRLLAGGDRVAGARYPEGLRVFLPSIQIGLSIALLMGSSLLLRGILDPPGEEAAGAGEEAVLKVAVERTAFAEEEGSEEGAASVGRAASALQTGAPDPWSALLSDLEGLEEVKEATLFSPGAWLGIGTTDTAFTHCGNCIVGNMWLPFYSPFVQHHVVSADSFSAMGVAVLEGREFTSADGPGAPLVAIVNEAYAREHFDSDGPLHRDLGIGRGVSGWYEVVGVVENFGITGVGSSAAPEAAVFLSAAQHPPDRVDLFLTVAGPTEALLEAVPELIGARGGFAVGPPPQTLEDYFAGAVAPFRWFGRVSLGLGLLTLALSSFGLYAILEYSVSLRREEIGVRRALGAGRGAIARLTLGRSARLYLLGLFLGLEGALFLTSGIEEVGFEGQVFDVPLFLGIGGILAFAAFLGTLRPTRHAVDVSPKVAMGGM